MVLLFDEWMILTPNSFSKLFHIHVGQL